MKLKIGNFPVRDVCLGSENGYKDGVLTVDKAAAIAYLKECDDHITDLDIVIARPGDDTRIVPVIETIEPRCRVDGRTLFPGVTDAVVPAGDGELNEYGYDQATYDQIMAFDSSSVGAASGGNAG